MERHKWKRPSRPADGIRIAGWSAVMAITAGVFLAAIGASDSEQGALVIGLCLMSGGLLILVVTLILAEVRQLAFEAAIRAGETEMA
jgi:hypothetical protein